MAVFDHARRCLRRRLSVVMVGRRACRMHLRCRFIVVVMVIAHLHGGSRLRSEEHTSDLQSLMSNSYAVFRLKKNKNQTHIYTHVFRQKTKRKRNTHTMR